jgi:hypothetical protein
MDTDALQRLDAFLSDPKVPQEDKNRAVAMARSQAGTAVPEPEKGGAISRALSYVTKRGREFVGAASRITQPQNLQRPVMEQLGDVATVAGPVVAPGLTAAGLVAGAGTSALGADPETAELADVATQFAGGVGGAVRGLTGAKAALRARYQKIAAAAAGRAMDPAKAMALGQDLMEGVESALTHPKELKAVRPLLEKITNPAAGPVTFKDLDEAKIAVQGIGEQRYVRGLLTKAMDETIAGTPEGAALKATNKAWSRVAKPKDMEKASFIQKPLLRGGGGFMTRGATAYGAYDQLREGHYGKAAGLGAVALLGGQSPGRLLTAAPAAARAVTSIAGTIAPDISQGASSVPPPEEPVEAPEETPLDLGSSPAVREAPGAPQAASRAPFGREIAAVGKVLQLDPRFIQIIVDRESGGNPNAVGSSGERGLMQIMPNNFEHWKSQVEAITGRPASIDDPLDTLIAGVLHMKNDLNATGGNVFAAARRYNGGPRGRSPAAVEYGRHVANRWRQLASRQ